MLSAYYTSPARFMSDQEAARLAWRNMHAQRLAYYRGAVYLWYLQGFVSEHTGGKRSLDDSVLGLVRLRRAGEPHGLEQWLKLLETDLGALARTFHGDMASGKWLVVPMELALGPEFTLMRSDQYAFELGMDEGSLKLGTITGVKPGSRAEVAGVRDGDRILWAQSVWLVADAYEARMEMRLQRVGEREERTIEWWPRSLEKVEAWEWQVVRTY